MSRSYKKSPVYSITGAESDKKDKQAAHQAQRAHFLTQMKSSPDLAEEVFEERNFAHSNSHTFAKEVKKRAPMSYRLEGDRLVVTAKPSFITSDRAAHTLLSK